MIIQNVDQDRKAVVVETTNYTQTCINYLENKFFIRNRAMPITSKIKK